MKTIIQFLAITVFFFAFNLNVHAQNDEATNYHMLSYMKVEPGMHQDYLKLEKVWKKIHQAQIKAGNQRNWVLDKVISPSGAHVEYNYITRQSFKGEKQLGNFLEGNGMPIDWKAGLNEEEIALVERTSKIRTMVKNEVWSTIDAVMADDYKNAKIHVFNFFDYPAGKTMADHIKTETELWKPLHEAKIKNKQAKGWVLISKEFPYGANDPYHSGTVDIYDSIEQMMTAPFEDLFKSVYPNKKPEDLMKETQANMTLIRGEVRMQLDRTE